MMIRLFTILILSFMFINCTNRKLTKKEIATVNKCRASWQYLNLQDTIRGEVLYHTKASFLCGIFATASSTIIKTTLNDTIRVLWLCNTDINFRTAEFVKISPRQKPSFSVSPPFSANKFDCAVKNTYYGFIESIPNSVERNSH